MLKYKGKFNKKVQTVIGEVEIDEFGLVKGLKKEDEDILLNGFNFEKAEESNEPSKKTATKKEEAEAEDKQPAKKTTARKSTSTRKTSTAKKDEEK